MRSPNFQVDADQQDYVSLRRCLKNWSKRHVPPKDSRQKLLDAAAVTQQQHKIWWRMRLFNALAWKASFTREARYYWLPVYGKAGYEKPKLLSDVSFMKVENYFLPGMNFRPVW